MSTISPVEGGISRGVFLGLLATVTASVLALPAIRYLSQISDAGEDSIDVPIDSNWRPPDPNHCGHDMKRFFTEYLLDEVAAMLMVDMIHMGYTIEEVEKKALLQGFRPYRQEHNSTSLDLKNKNCYFHQEGGSVFMDYKIMREKYLRSLGESKGLTGEKAVSEGAKLFQSRFNLDMSTDEVFRSMLDIVSAWW